jgi:inhibitor of cysteine peptidase
MLRSLALLPFLAVALAACAGGSGGASPQPSGSAVPETVHLDGSANGTTVAVDPSTPIAISLASNPTTGYSWLVTSVPDPAILAADSPIDGVYVADAMASGVVGSGGMQTWGFHAATAGTTTFTAEYARPWESGVPAVGAFTVTITVR